MAFGMRSSICTVAALASMFAIGRADAAGLECKFIAATTGNNSSTLNCSNTGYPYFAGGSWFSQVGPYAAYPRRITNWFFTDAFTVKTSGYSKAKGACCNELTMYDTADSTSGAATATCSGTYSVAVGGGGWCTDPTAKIIHSHPLPYGTGSVPKQWTFRCTKGGAHAVVNCGLDYSASLFSSCRVVRTVNPTLPMATARCPTGQLAVSGGGWCGNGYLVDTQQSTTLNVATASCSTNDTHGFAICCNATLR